MPASNKPSSAIISLNQLKTTPEVSRLFVKLLLGFWLCSSLIIGLFALLPLIQQNHDREPLPPSLERLLTKVADKVSNNFDPENPRFNKRSSRWQDQKLGIVRIYITNEQGEVINTTHVSRTFRHFLLMAEEAEHPISHQFRDELVFGPHEFTLNEQKHFIYGRLPNHHPRPWFFFFADHKLLSAGLAILLSGLICGMLAWYLGKPLRHLKNTANALASGDLSSRVNPQTSQRNDEMGELAVAFNSMADAIQTMVNNQQRLMGDISHELRTPLTRLQLSLALARKKGLDSKELDRIGYEAEQLDELIGELLSLSRITLNASATPMTTELAESLSQVLDDAEFEAEQQHKKLLIELDESLVFTHYPKPLARAVENLLRNAIRYADSEICLTVSEADNWVQISIRDDGPGIEEHELSAIFEPFYRPDSARDRESGGWGLGLAITQAAINAHKGDIVAQNHTPHGLLVTITLPKVS